MERTPKRAETDGFASTSSFATFSPFSPYSSASSSTMGATMRHGPHQVAQKSTMVSPSLPSTSAAKFSSFTSMIALLVAIPSPCRVEAPALRCRRRPSRPEIPRRRTLMNPFAPGDLPLDHVAIAVPSLQEARRLYELLLEAALFPARDARRPGGPRRLLRIPRAHRAAHARQRRWALPRAARPGAAPRRLPLRGPRGRARPPGRRRRGAHRRAPPSRRARAPGRLPPPPQHGGRSRRAGAARAR